MSTSSTQKPRSAERRQLPGVRSEYASTRFPPHSSRSRGPELHAYKSSLRSGSLTETQFDHIGDTKRRAALADGMQRLLRTAHEQSAKAEVMPRWVNSCAVPEKWQREALGLVEPIHSDMLDACQELRLAWPLLHPPLDAYSIMECERRYQRLERILGALERVMVDIEDKFLNGERWVACKSIQLWFRRRLARRGFYTKKLRIGRRHRGLIPGIFDSIPAKSKLTVHRRTGAITLEYPTSYVDHGFMEY